MKVLLALLLFQIANILPAHPVVPNDTSYEKYKIALLKISSQDSGSFRFMLLHNDFPRVQGRIYDRISPYDLKFVKEHKVEILANISNFIQLTSAKGSCKFYRTRLKTFPSVPINNSLRAPGHLIEADFTCPGRVSHLTNKLIALTEFNTMRQNIVECSETHVLSTDENGKIMLPQNCFH